MRHVLQAVVQRVEVAAEVVGEAESVGDVVEHRVTGLPGGRVQARDVKSEADEFVDGVVKDVRASDDGHAPWTSRGELSRAGGFLTAAERCHVTTLVGHAEPDHVASLRFARSGPRGRAGGWLGAVTEWAGAVDVYGSADEVPRLLAQAAEVTDVRAPVWDELWSRLCHQGTVAPASYAALPALVGIARSRADVAVDPALHLAAAIVGAMDVPAGAGSERDEYAVEIAALRELAGRKVGLVEARTDVIWTLLAVAAVEDLGAWSSHLEALVDGEVEADCPSCAEAVCVEVVDGVLVVVDEGETDGVAVREAEPGDLGPAEVRLLELCWEHGHGEVAGELRQLFGRATCPLCGASFRIADALD